MEFDYTSIVNRKPGSPFKERVTGFCHLLLISLFLFLTACRNNSNKNLLSPPGYDLNKPFVITLPSYLDEISGVVYYPKDKSVFAISDEKGGLYKIFLSGKMEIQKWKFEQKKDFEDLALVDSTFYVLQSSGHIFSLYFVSPDSITLKEYKLNLPGKNEFETLYHDRDQNRLIMLCKDCEADDKNSLSSWAFDLSALIFSAKPAYVTDVRKIDSLMQEKKVKFKPSAAAINPLTGQLFILSSVNKVLVVAGKDGNPENVYRINSGIFKQPEGLAFTPEGDLIISNEAGDTGAADILIFKYNKAQ